MSAVNVTDETVMEILERVDRGWQNRNPVPLSELIGSRPGYGDLGCVSEVVAADSEWRWRVAGFEAQASEESVLQSIADRRPHAVEDYLRELPQLRGDRDCVLRLIESEFLARSRWGNPPTIAEFSDRFGEIDGLDQHLVNALDEHAPLWVSREGRVLSSSQVSRVIVRTPLVIGRRTRDERHGRWLTEDGRRLIVVDNSEPGVSREHVRVTRVAIDRVLIMNISSQSMLGINGVDALPGAAQQLLLPVTLDVGSGRLRLAVW